MFENSNHQKAYDLLTSGQFRKAHTLLEKKMSVNMGGIIWLDYLYLNTIVHPKRFNLEQLEEIMECKPDWDFIKQLVIYVRNQQLELAQKHIYENFETINTIRQSLLNSSLSAEDIQKVMNQHNKPV